MTIATIIQPIESYTLIFFYLMLFVQVFVVVGMSDTQKIAYKKPAYI